MTIQNKNLGKLILLNCLTLGIYGAIMHQRMGNEINAMCDGDGEQPRLGYLGTVFVYFASFVVMALVTLLATALSGGIAINPYGNIAAQIIALITSNILSVILLSVCSTLILLTSIYREFWWYKQAGRLKLNAWRYGLVVRESGTDVALFRSVLYQLPLAAITLLSWILHLLVPAFVCWLIGLIAGSLLVGWVFFGICAAIFFALFARDCTAGAYLATYFVYKNINRIIDSGLNMSAFDPMSYEYYPSVSNNYANFVPHLVYDEYATTKDTDAIRVAVKRVEKRVTPEVVPVEPAYLEAVKGSNKGYRFDLRPGEEVVIGRDPAKSNIVVDSIYDQVSGRHVGVMFQDQSNNFRVIDYSLNGTFVDGRKLENGKEYIFPRGSRIELADAKNAFVLK